MAETLDMQNRDPEDLNSFLKVEFHDVIAEPDGLHSHDCAYSCAFKTYNASKNCCYMVLSLLCGGPLALCFGFYFACLGFDYIWCIMPCTRAYIIEIECAGKIFGYCIRSFCDPFFESLSKVLGGIVIKK